MPDARGRRQRLLSFLGQRQHSLVHAAGRWALGLGLGRPAGSSLGSAGGQQAGDAQIRGKGILAALQLEMGCVKTAEGVAMAGMPLSGHASANTLSLWMAIHRALS